MRCKETVFFFTALALFFCLDACVNANSEDFVAKGPSVDEENPVEVFDSTLTKTFDSMIEVYHPELLFFIGTDKPSARASEKPQMGAKLNYKFYMDVHEFTCGDYKKLDKEFDRLKPNCANDSLPLTDVTYFDAILIANAKSKSLGLDTVYTYTNASFDEENHCTDIEGLVTHLEIEGFRLPTEAEWNLSAQLGWDHENSWNNSNSDYKVHTVCSKGFDGAGFCDFSGNITEWTNDWLGILKDTTITNFTGSTDGGEIGERIIKGGNYNSDKANSNLYSRGDVYSVTSSTMAKYVGFRLALGVIPKPAWFTSNGHISESKIEPIASAATLKSYTGSYNMKLAFRNDVTNNLAFIDYNNGNLKVLEIHDTLNVYHPEISPNGKFVAFSTKPEGIQGESKLYVRELSENSSTPIELQVKSAAIPRWRILENGDTAIVYVTDAGNNSEESSWLAQSTWQVTFANDKFGTPQKLFDGTFHGGIAQDNSLSVTGAKRLRVRYGQKNDIWYSQEQACNVSLAQDGSKRTAFLDFGGKTGQEFVGSHYATHERILIADSTGKLIQSIVAPNGYTFDHTEWVSSTSNLVATLTNINGSHKKIVLVSTADTTFIDLAEGEELWHPCLWVQPKKIIPKPKSSSSSFAQSSSSSAHAESSSSSTPTLNSSSSTSPQSSSSNEPAQSSSSSEIAQSSSSEKQVPSSSSEQINSSSSSLLAESSSSEVTSSSSVEESSSSTASSSSESSSSGVPYQINFELDTDSAGVYYKAGQAQVFAEARYKMELLWQYKDKADVVIIGSSRAQHGVAPMELSEEFFGVNLAFIGNTLSGSEFLYDNYIIPHMSKVKYIVSSIDIDRGFNTFSGSFFNGRAKICPGYVYDKDHNYWKDGYPEGLAELTYDSPGISSYANKYRQTRGLDSIPGASVWEEMPQVDSDSNLYRRSPGSYRTNFNSLKKMVETAHEKGIYFIGVVFPQNPNYKKTGAFGRYGIPRSEAPILLQEIADLSKTYPNFILFDENKMGDHDYTGDMAYDRDHLAYPGAIHFTARLDSLLKELPALK